MKPKVAVGLSYFNSVHELPRLLDPVYKHVDLVIAVDGRYPLFDWPENISTDGSKELLINKYNAITQEYYEPVEQITKRNQYLYVAENEGMDFVLVLDTDEYLHPHHRNWNKFYRQLAKLPNDELLANMWAWISPDWIKNHNAVTNNTWKEYTKVIRPDRVRYNTTHWTFIDKDKPNEFIEGLTTIDGIRLSADSKLRSSKYIDAGYKWAESQLKQEDERMGKAGIKWFNMWNKKWKRDFEKILSMPGTKITYDGRKSSGKS